MSCDAIGPFAIPCMCWYGKTRSPTSPPPSGCLAEEGYRPVTASRAVCCNRPCPLCVLVCGATAGLTQHGEGGATTAEGQRRRTARHGRGSARARKARAGPTPVAPPSQVPCAAAAAAAALGESTPAAAGEPSLERAPCGARSPCVRGALARSLARSLLPACLLPVGLTHLLSAAGRPPCRP